VVHNRGRQIDPGVSFDDVVDAVLRAPFGFLLESGGPFHPHARWSYAGVTPCAVLSGDLTEATVHCPHSGDQTYRGPALDGLEQLLSSAPDRIEADPVPFAGGVVGFISYDAGKAFEDLPDRARRDFSMPHFHWAFYHELLAYDRREDTFWLIKHPVPEQFDASSLPPQPMSSLLDEIRTTSTRPPEPPRIHSTQWNVGSEQYREMIRSAKSHIRAGDIYQVNLSRRMMVEGPEDPAPLYQRLRSTNPAPYSGYIRAPSCAVLSSSPELFLRRRGQRIVTRPIKGTRSRAESEAANRRHKNDLLNSEKDLAELHMIVDLERNDLGRICEYGSVETDALHELETFANVHHLVGTVSGTLRENVTLREILRATFPGGSITGTPKIRAMEIIDQLEPTRRQVYTGVMGWIGPGGDLELNICIRTMEWQENTLCFQVGGGIVADSDPEKEFRETQDKARGMLTALDADQTGDLS